jgi:hypothetical protein
VVRPIHKQVTIPCGKYIKHRSAVYLRTAVLYLVYIKTLFGPHVSGCADDVRGPFEKFVNWRQCAVVLLLCLPLHNSGALPLVHELF